MMTITEVAEHLGLNQYMTVILDYETGRVAWMTKARSFESPHEFFPKMCEEQKNNLQFISMAM